MDPSDIDTSLKPRRIEGFPFVEESDLYPEFRQSDEENDDPGPLPPVMATLRPQISPVSSSQESYMQPPAYSPRFQRPMEGMSISEGSRLQATGQSRVSHFHRVFPPGPFYGYLGSGAEVELLPPFYMPDVSPRSSAMSSSPSYPPEGPFRHPTIPEEREELRIHQYGASGHALSLVHSPPSSRSTEIWQPPDFPFLGQEGPRLALPPRHSSYLHRDLPEPPPYPSHSRTLSTTSQLPSSSAFLQLEAPRAHLSRSPSRFPPQGPSAKHITMQQAQKLGQLRHTAHGMAYQCCLTQAARPAWGAQAHCTVRARTAGGLRPSLGWAPRQHEGWISACSRWSCSHHNSPLSPRPLPVHKPALQTFSSALLPAPASCGLPALKRCPRAPATPPVSPSPEGLSLLPLPLHLLKARAASGPASATVPTWPLPQPRPATPPSPLHPSRRAVMLSARCHLREGQMRRCSPQNPLQGRWTVQLEASKMTKEIVIHHLYRKSNAFMLCDFRLNICTSYYKLFTYAQMFMSSSITPYWVHRINFHTSLYFLQSYSLLTLNGVILI